MSQVVNNDGSINRYEVPNMNDETWIPSRPKTHTNSLLERNKSFGEEFKKMIKMMKWWNHQHSSLLQSYHIEVLSLNILVGTFSNFPWESFNWFDKAHGLCGSSLWHDGAYADAYLDWNTRQEVLKRLATARDKSRDAWYLTHGQNDDHKRAIELWRQVFGDKFPAYGS
ncbi:MAG: hypothetical protein HYX73_02215 [Acidobacteria bacterium]|nr:hypothetical protein [Acidobacteriota bacterium]